MAIISNAAVSRFIRGHLGPGILIHHRATSGLSATMHDPIRPAVPTNSNALLGRKVILECSCPKLSVLTVGLWAKSDYKISG